MKISVGAAVCNALFIMRVGGHILLIGQSRETMARERGKARVIVINLSIRPSLSLSTREKEQMKRNRIRRRIRHLATLREIR